MSKYNFPLIVVLFFGLIILYVLRLMPQGSASEERSNRDTSAHNDSALVAKPISSSGAGLKIAYINTDTILEKYDFYQDAKEAFEKDRKQLEREMEFKLKSFEKEVMEAQQKAQSGGMTYEEYQNKQQEFQAKEQNLMAFRESSQQKLIDKEAELTKNIQNNISNIVESISDTAGYSYVLGHSSVGVIWYAKESYDITELVLKTLNKKNASDSAAVSK